MTIASKRTDVPVLEVKNLTITHAHDAAVLVGPLSLTIHSGECLAIVGDSGSGKSLTLKALMGLLPSEMLATTEGFLYRGQHVNELSVRGWNALRGAEIALVQQDTGLALDPLSRVEREVREAAWVHARRARTSTRQLDAQFVTQQLLEAGLSHPEQFLRRWPHQLSGGQRQRVVLASSLSADPALLLADEPTTALDESVQHTVLTRLEEFTRAGGAVLLVSHDEAVVRRLAHRVLYLESGRLHDHRTREAIRLGSLQSPLPMNSQDEPKPPVCDARDLSFTYLAGAGIRDVSIQLHAGRIVGVLGASGSGKTTLAKALTGLLPGVQGTITLDSLDWLRLPERVRRSDRWRLQWVPQDALASFPRGMSVAGLLDEALRCRGLASSRTKASGSASLRDHIRQQRSSLLTAVGLDQNLAHRRPSTLSGGQRQRVAIARALAARPHVLICDESVSALDARSKLGILELLRTVATRDGCAVLFISHDEGAVRQIADRVLMMRDGRLLDTSDSEFPGETR